MPKEHPLITLIESIDDDSDMEVVKQELGRLLVSADPNTKRSTGYTALMNLAWNWRDCSELIELLVERGAAVDQEYEGPNSWGNGQTAIFHCCGSADNMLGHIENLKTLMRLGGDVNHRDRSGCAPIHYIVFQDAPDHLKCLVEAGADIEAEDDMGYGALDSAIDAGNFLAVVELMRSGAKIERSRGRDRLNGSDARPFILEKIAELIETPGFANDENWVSMAYRSLKTQAVISVIDQQYNYEFLLGDNQFLDDVDARTIIGKLEEYAVREPTWSWRINEMIRYLEERE